MCGVNGEVVQAQKMSLQAYSILWLDQYLGVDGQNAWVQARESQQSGEWGKRSKLNAPRAAMHCKCGSMCEVLFWSLGEAQE
jgi:hypothetical protein